MADSVWFGHGTQPAKSSPTKPVQDSSTDGDATVTRRASAQGSVSPVSKTVTTVTGTGSNHSVESSCSQEHLNLAVLYCDVLLLCSASLYVMLVSSYSTLFEFWLSHSYNFTLVLVCCRGCVFLCFEDEPTS